MWESRGEVLSDLGNSMGPIDEPGALATRRRNKRDDDRRLGFTGDGQQLGAGVLGSFPLILSERS
jgi:hypothetical protein